MGRILFEPHRRQLGKELADQAGVHEALQAGWEIVDDDELVELVGDALGRDVLDSARISLTASTISSSGARSQGAMNRAAHPAERILGPAVSSARVGARPR